MPCVDVLALQLRHTSVYQLHQPASTPPMYAQVQIFI